MAERLQQAPPSYFDLDGELNELHRALRVEGSWLFRHPLLEIRLSLHCIERMIARGVPLRTLVHIVEFGEARGVQSVGSHRMGKWTMAKETFGFPKFHGVVHFTLIADEIGHVEIAIMGETGQTAAGHIRVQWSIESACIPRSEPEEAVDRSNGFLPLVARILDAHGRDNTPRTRADQTPHTRTDTRKPSASFEPQGSEILLWIGNQAAQRAAAARRQDLGRISRSLEAIEQESPPVMQPPIVAKAPASQGGPWHDPAFVPPRSAGRTVPTKTAALRLPPDPWSGPPVALRSEEDSGLLQRSASASAPALLARSEDSSWM